MKSVRRRSADCDIRQRGIPPAEPDAAPASRICFMGIEPGPDEARAFPKNGKALFLCAPLGRLRGFPNRRDAAPRVKSLHRVPLPMPMWTVHPRENS